MDDNLPNGDYFSVKQAVRDAQKPKGDKQAAKATAASDPGTMSQEPNKLQYTEISESVSAADNKLYVLLAEMFESRLEDLGLIQKLMADMLAANRVRVWKFSANRERLELVHEWVSEDEKPMADNWKTLDSLTVPWTLRQLNQSQIVVLEDVAEMAIEAEKDKEMLQRQQISNCLWIPFPIGYELGGAIQADNLENLKLWTNLKLMERLSLAAKGLGTLFKPNKNEELEKMDEDGVEYRMIFESVDVGIVVLDLDSRIKKMNAYAAEMFGMGVEAMEGKSFDEFINRFSTDSIEVLHRNLGMLHMGTPIPPFEMEVEVGPGELKVLELRAAVMKEEGGVTGDLILIHDATIKKQIERAVEESEKRLRTVLESVKQGIMFSDEEGHFLIFNSEMEQITGYTKAEANAAVDFYQLIHPNQDTNLPMEDLSKLEEGEKRSGEVVIFTKSGLKKNVIVSTTVLSHEGKKMFLSAFHDVTARKKVEDELRNRNVELERITAQLNQTMVELQTARDNLEDKVREKTEELRQTLLQVEDLARFPSEDPFPVLRVSPGGQLKYVNAAGQALMELWKTKIGGDVPVEWRGLVAEVFEKNSRRIAEVELNKSIISFAIVPVRSGGYVNMYGRDVTQEKEVEKMKNEFISLVSHQIRTPLTSMRWYSEMLIKAQQNLTPEQLETVKTIHQTAVKLAELVSNLLNISRMESGRIKFEPQMNNLPELIAAVINELKPFALEKGVLVKYQPGDVGEFVFDQNLVKEVMTNLLSNAIKYSNSNGQVEIRTKKNGEETVVEVADNGLGIPKDSQKEIFQRFYRAQNAVDADIEGTGLGLSVAKMIVEKCGGKMWFESEPNVKTSFYFSLPQNLVEVDQMAV